MQFLAWVRLTDDDGALSLTHLALFIALGLMIAGRQIEWTALGGFIAALGSYRIKRAIEDRDDSQTTADKLAKIDVKMGRLESVLPLATREQLRGQK